MKHAEFSKCAWCGRGMAAAGVHFYRVSVEMFVLDNAAIRRAAGLEMMVGNPAIARVMGPNEDLARLMTKTRALICADCALKAPVAAILDGDEGGGS